MSLPPLPPAALSFSMFSHACFELPSAVRLEMTQRLHEGKLTLREAVASGYSTAERVDEWVDFWHDNSVPCELRELLGLSRDEYAEFMKDSSVLTCLFETKSAPIQRTFGEEDFIPMSYWGKDHWSTLGYLETVMVECGGFQVGADPRMKSNRRNFRVMSQECAKPKRASNHELVLALPMEPQHATKLNDGQQVARHDDWSCVQDMAAEGFFGQTAYDVEPGTMLQFSEKGNKVANALREFRRNGGQMADFRWPVVPASDGTASAASSAN